ncbi:hypothetical protein [Chryseobacterium terrae]|uniref:Single-stranded DNA-binding protein n=1 Tax=Chryseobacterium terrae TaxID=3163299 RepID=A0ABW8Y498_9FLAO
MSNKPLNFYGQINYTDLKAAMMSGKVKMQKVQTKDGEKIFVDVNVWVHDEADKYNNNASVQSALKKEAYEAGEKNTYYVGNLRYLTPKNTEISSEDVEKAFAGDDDDDLPF